MNLFLFSGGTSEENHSMNLLAIQAIKESNAKEVVYIATPHSDDSFAQSWLHQYFNPDLEIKFTPYFIDSENTTESISAFENASALILTGGNTFYIAKHLKEHGVDEKIKSLALKGYPIIGFSAGTILQTPTINLANYPSYDCDENVVQLTDLAGLNFVKFEAHPHYSESIDEDKELAQYSLTNGRPIYALHDGSGIIVNGIKEKMFGNIVMFDNGIKVKVACAC